MYRQIAAESENEVSRESAELRLLQIDSLDERDVIDAVMHAYFESNGRCIDNWQQILPQLSGRTTVNGRPLRLDDSKNVVDPGGTPYLIDPKQCKAIIDGARSKVPAV